MVVYKLQSLQKKHQKIETKTLTVEEAKETHFIKKLKNEIKYNPMQEENGRLISHTNALASLLFQATVTIW